MTNSPVANNAGVVNVNYFMTIKDNFSNCSVATPQCVDAKGTLSDPVAGLRVVAVRCFSDAGGTTNVDCTGSVKSVRLIKGVMETVWPGVQVARQPMLLASCATGTRRFSQGTSVELVLRALRPMTSDDRLYSRPLAH